ncbi:cbb3-type cytochrome c oxidase subunit I [Phyllobacterium meliloti]|uniref:cbb3-type cytochrome c oxidase subunit I n=1 Tax=Phyllobacterium meliloti TaxID=555317 RepID=UPI001D135A7E|nr:cbb3-type cytochrome c oxidase subunit I [Phyllobacterium sp. T1293]UGX85688.1 cbb3-type cytochrome c oxidase subunit I [Phyllobacterium sp. T1293]
MPRVSQLFFKTATVFFLIGIILGLQMGISGDHAAFPAHAHLNLLGWVTSAIFGIYYALNPARAEGRLPMIQFAIFTIGVIIMIPALYFLNLGNTAMEPLVGIGSFIVLAGVALFAAVVFSNKA